jgi:hypothetical protein
VKETLSEERNPNAVKFFPSSTTVLATLWVAGGLTGCKRSPTFNILGSFFPAWLICMFAGVILAVAANRLLVRFRLDKELAWAIVIYPCLALLFACVLWLTFFS